MFTILNFINYFSGKYCPLYLLILLTIGIYFYIIKLLFNELKEGNTFYIILLFIVMLIDITSMILIFSSDFNSNFEESNNININIKKKKSKKNSKKKSKSKSKSKNDNINSNIQIEKITNNQINEINEILSLYDNNKNGSIHTY